MWDVRNIVNYCVKCESKFTTPEKPLKLLPCLHSMCLDCLYGRFPISRKTDKKKEVNTESDSVVHDADSEKARSASETGGACVESVDGLPNESTRPTKATSPSNIADSESKTSVHDEDNGETNAASEKTSEHGSGVQAKEGEEVPHLDLGAETNKTVGVGEECRAPVTSPETDSRLNSTSNLEEEEGDSKTRSTCNNAAKSTSDLGEGTSSKEFGDHANGEDEDQTEMKPKPVTECPICRDPIDQPGLSLMDNMFASLDPDLDDSTQSNSNHICTACEEGQQAESYCVQCEEWLCESCVDAHKRVRITKDHVISPKDEVKVVTSKSPWEQLMTCKQHKQEQLKFFCEKCEKLTCRDCQLLDHKDHKYQFLDQAAEQYKARLKGSLALMGEKRSKLMVNRDEIELKLSNCKEQKDTLQQDILKQADVLVKGIRQAVWGVLSNLASFTDAATKRLNKEIDDVSDLVTKFDHCIQFMEDILRDGSSMSLLYSKGSVEAKCRKVYHTQVDPQSLKGTLLIQYKHDVNWLLGNLNKIGAIFVNGVRYPPDKNGGHARPSQGNHSYQEQRVGAGLGATSTHLQHMANQLIPGQRVPSEWTKFKPSGQQPAPPNMTLSGLRDGGTLPPQLTLPSNRRAHSSNLAQPWQGPQGIPGSTFPGHFVAGQLMTPQQQQQQTARPTFTPMRLHHRPATQVQFPGHSEHSSQNMRSPPQYRMGGEASGTPRSAHGTPDPARPASAGMYDSNGRPDSGGGPAMDIKKEKRDHSPDCVIMSSSLKNDRPSVFQTTPQNSRISDTVLEMQRNLDDVIRAVPMDMSDNLEQISGSKQSAEPVNKIKPPSCDTVTDNNLTDAGALSPTDEELRENWQGGNSMPGFSLSQADAHVDPNDDYCACCHNGGDVLCCDRCPKVFHLQCHIPELASVPTGSFVCTLCAGEHPIDHEEITSSGKRKNPGGLGEQEVQVCQRILLELLCHPSSVPFQEPVNKVQVPNYYKIITQPMDLMQIRSKLEGKHTHYQSIKAFLYDVRQIFINCAIYNKAGSEVGKAGKIVRDLFESMVERLMSQYLSFVKENPTPCFSALQQKIDPEMGNSNTDRQPNFNADTSGPSSPKKAKVAE